MELYTFVTKPLWLTCPGDNLEGSDLDKAEIFLMFLVLPHVAYGQVVALAV